MKIKQLLVGACLMGVVVGGWADDGILSVSPNEVTHNYVSVVCNNADIKDVKLTTPYGNFKVVACYGNWFKITPEDNEGFCNAICARSDPDVAIDIKVGEGDESFIIGLGGVHSDEIKNQICFSHQCN